MTSGNLDANWSEDPTQQPALNLIVIDKPVNTDPGGKGGGGGGGGGGGEEGIKSVRSNGVSVLNKSCYLIK